MAAAQTDDNTAEMDDTSGTEHPYQDAKGVFKNFVKGGGFAVIFFVFSETL